MTRSHCVSTSLGCLYILLSINPSPGQVNIDLVVVGNVNNAGDTLVNQDGTSGYGGVGQVYRIGRTEVSNADYTVFLNAVADADPNGLYNALMGTEITGGIARSGSSPNFTYAVRPNMGNKPVNFVSWLDAARFANWLHKGQPNGAQGAGTTETGTYDLTVANPGVAATRQAGATWVVPSENEWYKAAYHDPVNPAADLGGTIDYWLYPTRADLAPIMALAAANGDVSNAGVNVANYGGLSNWNGSVGGNVLTVGGAGALSESFYGTRDQGGNVHEWNEAVLSGANRGIRGGSFNNNETNLRASGRQGVMPTFESSTVGFRVGRVPPCTCKGDVSLNGAVNGGDVNGFVAQLLSGGNPDTSAAACAADMSGNGSIGNEDVPLFTNAVLSGQCGQ